MTEIIPEPRLLIDGALVDASSKRRYGNINPASEELIGQTADAGPDDMDRAIAAARRAFDQTRWSTDLALRSRCMRQLYQALIDNRDALRAVLVAESGTPRALTHGPQLDLAIKNMLWDIECAERFEWERELGAYEFMGFNSQRRVRHEAVGVAALITPWNFPMVLNLAKLTPALMAGCTAVLKPAPDTPWSATWLGKLIVERTDIPAGVLNVITSSDPATVGDMLSADPRVDMISFTGSTPVGKRIMQRAAGNVKRTFLELGGKSAQIFLDDADFDKLFLSALTACIHAGQGCAICTRLLLPKSRYAEGVEILEEAFSGIQYGDPNDMKHMMGPLINARQRDRVLTIIQQAKADGARLVTGGGRPSQLPRGYYVEPTLFVDVDPNSTLAQEEVFGPVLAVIPYDDDDDAVRIANHSRFGLSGGVESESLERAFAVANRIRTGTVSVNGALWVSPDAPFGGYKESGVGREHGVEGFREYLQAKTIAYPAD